jgi:hypothetical protein
MVVKMGFEITTAVKCELRDMALCSKVVGFVLE